jgi:hypothetical protein
VATRGTSESTAKEARDLKEFSMTMLYRWANPQVSLAREHTVKLDFFDLPRSYSVFPPFPSSHLARRRTEKSLNPNYARVTGKPEFTVMTAVSGSSLGVAKPIGPGLSPNRKLADLWLGLCEISSAVSTALRAQKCVRSAGCLCGAVWMRHQCPPLRQK